MSATMTEEPMTAEIPKVPWHADSYIAIDGTTIHRVVDARGSEVLRAASREAAHLAASGVNGEHSEQAILDVQARWQRALDAAHDETDQVRAHFHAELATHRRALESRDREIARLQLLTSGEG